MEHAGRFEHHRWTNTYHILVFAFFIFHFLPVPWALHLPPGPTASIKREWEIKSYHAIDSKIEELYKLAKRGHRVALVHGCHFFPVCKPQHSHTQIMRLNKNTGIKDFLVSGSFTLWPGDFLLWQEHTYAWEVTVRAWWPILNETLEMVREVWGDTLKWKITRMAMRTQ